MKKYVIGFLLIFTLCMMSCGIARPNNETETGASSNFEVREGMTVSYVDSLQIDYLRYGSYLFLYYDGSNIVAKISSNDHSTLEKVEMYVPISPVDSDFEKIKVGMTVFQVVESVGLPEGSFTHGMNSLYFNTTEGNVFVVYFNDSNTVSEVVRSTRTPD